MLKGEEVVISQMFLDFRDLVNASDGMQVPQHLQRFNAYADIYESFDGFAIDSREGLFFHRLDEMDTSTVFPLLLEIFKRQSGAGNIDERDQILTDLESFLVRRVVCGLSAKGYNRLFGHFASKLRANNGDLSAAGIRKELTSEAGDSQRWPDDDEFRHAWMTIDFYKRVKKSVQRMILEGIEATLHTGKTEKVKIERKLTIEHLLPQEWEAHWPIIVREQSATSTEQARERRISSVHRVGNLTLLTKELNPSISNGQWLKKRDEILKHSALNLNRPFRDVATWDEDAVEHRSKALFDSAVKIWPHPGTK